MVEDKVAMPVDGSGTEMTPADANGEVASRRDSQSAGGLPNAGESGGGAYPNPHSGKDGADDGPDKALGHGGQSGMRYHGHGQLGDEDVVGEPRNAPAKGD